MPQGVALLDYISILNLKSQDAALGGSKTLRISHFSKVGRRKALMPRMWRNALRIWPTPRQHGFGRGVTLGLPVKRRLQERPYSARSHVLHHRAQ